MSSEFASDACCCFFNIRPAMVSKKHLDLTKKQAPDRYEMFAPPLFHTALPSSCQEVASSSHRHTAPPPSHQEEASFDDFVVEMWVVAPPPPTCLEEASSDDTPSASLGYNNECPHVKDVRS
jgi:hypothetical protein